MRFLASLLILIGLFIIIWTISEVLLSINHNNVNGLTENVFGSPWSGLFLIAVGGSLLIYMKRKIR